MINAGRDLENTSGCTKESFLHLQFFNDTVFYYSMNKFFHAKYTLVINNLREKKKKKSIFKK